MRCLIQRVKTANVKSDHHHASIDEGYCIFVAVKKTDSVQDAEYCAQKIANLRIMEDENHKMNRNIKESGGEILLISQFTLYANTRKGNRPSFLEAAEPKKALALYSLLQKKLIEAGIEVKCGEFGAYMLVNIENDGPVTISINSPQRSKNIVIESKVW